VFVPKDAPMNMLQLEKSWCKQRDCFYHVQSELDEEGATREGDAWKELSEHCLCILLSVQVVHDLQPRVCLLEHSPSQLT
jgi:hypothetical protein